MPAEQKFVTFDVSPEVVIQTVFRLSQPQGMGFLHYVADYELSDREAAKLIESNGSIHLDYIQGRACKFNAKVANGKVVMPFNSINPWYDHPLHVFAELMLICKGSIS